MSDATASGAQGQREAVAQAKGGNAPAATGDTSRTRRRVRITWLRRVVQVGVLALFAAPVLLAGYSLFGLGIGGDEAASATPATLPFFGSLSSSTIGGLTVLDPFATLEVAAASRTLSLDWLAGAAVVLVAYGLVRARAFCGWACPVNLLLELVDALRRRLGIKVRETPVPRRAKMGLALATVAGSALTAIPLFEAFSPISAINKGILFGSVSGLWVLAAIVVSELFWAHRVWCRALCPLGGFYEAIGRVGQVNVQLDQHACIRCDACKGACLADPAILEPLLDGRDVIVRAGDCMACGACIDACPTHALSLRVGRPRRPTCDTPTP